VIWIDWVILVVLGVSMIVSVFRGLAREVLSLFAWVAAAWVALEYAPLGATWLVPWVPAPSVRLLLSGGTLFLLVLLVLGLVNALVAKLIRGTGLSGTDRSLGMVFGLARGVAIVTLLVLVAGATPVPEDPWWRQSTLLRHFERLAIEIRRLLPDAISGFIHFPGDPPATASGPPGAVTLPPLPLGPAVETPAPLPPRPAPSGEAARATSSQP
jgi:membrane protein required for colicin V production